MQDTSGVHVWLVLGKAFRALATRAEVSLNLSGTSLGDSEFRVLEVLLRQDAQDPQFPARRPDHHRASQRCEERCRS